MRRGKVLWCARRPCSAARHLEPGGESSSGSITSRITRSAPNSGDVARRRPCRRSATRPRSPCSRAPARPSRPHDTRLVVDDVDSLHDSTSVQRVGPGLRPAHGTTAVPGTGHGGTMEEHRRRSGSGDGRRGPTRPSSRSSGRRMLEVRYVVDPDLRAPGIALAREHGIRCETDAGVVTADAEVDRILETGGDRAVRADLGLGDQTDGRLMSPAGSRLVTSLVAAIAAVEEDARVETGPLPRGRPPTRSSPPSSADPELRQRHPRAVTRARSPSSTRRGRRRRSTRAVEAALVGARQAAAARRPAVRRPRRGSTSGTCRPSTEALAAGRRPPRRDSPPPAASRAPSCRPTSSRTACAVRASRTSSPCFSELAENAVVYSRRRRRRWRRPPRYAAQDGRARAVAVRATTASASPSAASRDDLRRGLPRRPRRQAATRTAPDWASPSPSEIAGL